MSKRMYEASTDGSALFDDGTKQGATAERLCKPRSLPDCMSWPSEPCAAFQRQTADIERLTMERDTAIAELQAHMPGIEEWEQMKAENERLRDAIEYALPFSGTATREVLERALEPVTNGE